MAPISSTSAWRQLRWQNSGAKCRITVAKRDGRTGMAASLGGDTPAITARSLRHSTPPQMAKVELRGCHKTSTSRFPRNAPIRNKSGRYSPVLRRKWPISLKTNETAEYFFGTFMKGKLQSRLLLGSPELSDLLPVLELSPVLDIARY